jgi:hypothetical protein
VIKKGKRRGRMKGKKWRDKRKRKRVKRRGRESRQVPMKCPRPDTHD